MSTIGIGIRIGKVQNGALLKQPPIVPDGTPTSAYDVTDVSFKVVSSVDTKSETVVTLEYGTVSEVYPNTVTAAESPVNSTGDVNFTLTGLTPFTDYYYRVKAVNSAGTAYSQEFVQKTNSIAEVVACTTGLTTPLSATEIGLLNILAASLKSGLGVTELDDFFDYLNIRAGETAEQSLRNFAKRAHDSTAVNSPTFTAHEGFTGNGTSSYIEVNYINTDAVNNTQNNSSYGLYFRNFNRATFTGNGVIAGSNARVFIGTAANNAELVVALNGGGAPVQSDSNTNGLYILNRLNATEINYFRNKVKSAAIANNSIGMINTKGCELARRTSDGSVGQFHTSQIAFSFRAKGLTDAQQAVIVDAFEAYMDAKGKGVIA